MDTKLCVLIWFISYPVIKGVLEELWKVSNKVYWIGWIIYFIGGYLIARTG